jgi:hypothetical protein
MLNFFPHQIVEKLKMGWLTPGCFFIHDFQSPLACNPTGLHDSLVDHGVDHFDETGDIGPDHVVARRSVLRCRIQTCLVNTFSFKPTKSGTQESPCPLNGAKITVPDNLIDPSA